MRIFLFSIAVVFFVSLSCEKSKDEKNTDILQLSSVRLGTVYLSLNENKTGIPVDENAVIEFNNLLDTSTIPDRVILKNVTTQNITATRTEWTDERMTIVMIPSAPLENNTAYVLQILAGIKGIKGESFPGAEYHFTTVNGKLKIDSVLINHSVLSSSLPARNIDFHEISLEVNFSEELDPLAYSDYFVLSGNVPYSLSLSADNRKVTLTAGDLRYYTRYYFTVSSNLKAKNGFTFNGFSGSFYTSLDSSLKFPLISDEELLTKVQQQTFRYFWDFAHPHSGMIRERNTSGDVVTTGGSGFGIMALIVGMERNFIPRSEGMERLDKILSFLETCDRFHGAWPHWLNGYTGKTVAFSTKDDGGDLVETSFLIQGLLTMRQYLNQSTPEENLLINRISALADSVEYDFYTRGEEVLYWHWSPVYDWEMNLPIRGYNEALITYILAASSKTHGISEQVYKNGFTANGAIVNGRTYYGYTLPLGYDFGGPLFFAHYSFLGLDPRNLKDDLADFWEQNVNHSLINWAYCSDNPKKYIGYNEVSWGLTASDDPWGYGAHSPVNDPGVITPTAAISSVPYTPLQSMKAIRHFYYVLGDRLWGDYGFYDAFDVTEGWWANSYLAIDQGPIICMIENYRSGLLWDLFMSNPDVTEGLNKLGFTY